MYLAQTVVKDVCNNSRNGLTEQRGLQVKYKKSIRTKKEVLRANTWEGGSALTALS